MVARFQPLRLFFPEAIGLAAAIDAQAAAAAGELVDAAADFFAADRSFDELDAPRNPRQVGHIVGDMRAFGRSGEQQAGEADRVDDIVGADRKSTRLNSIPNAHLVCSL